MEQDMTKYTDTIVDYGTQYGLNIVFAVLIFIIGMMIAGWVKRMVIKMCNKSSKIDDTLGAFFSSPECTLGSPQRQSHALSPHQQHH